MLVCKLYLFHCTSLSALGVSAIMRYINRRFTYLLTLWKWMKWCRPLFTVACTVHAPLYWRFGARLQIGTTPKPSCYVSHYWTTWLLSSRHVFHLSEPFLFTFIAVVCSRLSSVFAAWLCLIAYGSGFTLMHKAIIGFMDIWLGLSLSVTDRVSVRHTPELIPDQHTRLCAVPIL